MAELEEFGNGSHWYDDRRVFSLDRWPMTTPSSRSPEVSHGSWVDHAHRRVAEAGLRTGAARAAVIEHLAGEGQCLITAQELGDALRAQGKGSTASVYRALDELLGLELVHRIHGQDGIARFEIAQISGHHHHFVDDESGHVTAFEDAELERAIHAIGERLGVDLSSHEVILRGTSRKAPAPPR